MGLVMTFYDLLVVLVLALMQEPVICFNTSGLGFG